MAEKVWEEECYKDRQTEEKEVRVRYIEREEKGDGEILNLNVMNMKRERV